MSAREPKWRVQRETETPFVGETSVSTFEIYREGRPWGHVGTLKDEATANALVIEHNAFEDLVEALDGWISIGKRDLTNPKYDGYFEAARVALAKAGRR